MSEAAMIIVPTDISTMIREVETAYNRYLNEFRIPEDHKIVVNFSAGKDSTTTATIAHNLFGDRAQFVMVRTMRMTLTKRITRSLCRPFYFISFTFNRINRQFMEH
ncbi:hypothetical protein ACL0YQ_001471 [Citrobacter freundii]